MGILSILLISIVVMAFMDTEQSITTHTSMSMALGITVCGKALHTDLQISRELNLT